jgi:hypothetical protein
MGAHSIKLTERTAVAENSRAILFIAPAGFEFAMDPSTGATRLGS